MTSEAMKSIFFAFGTPSMGELIIILLIVLVLFGGSKMPEIARSLGKGIKELKKTLNDINAPDKDE